MAWIGHRPRHGADRLGIRRRRTAPPGGRGRQVVPSGAEARTLGPHPAGGCSGRPATAWNRHRPAAPGTESSLPSGTPPRAGPDINALSKLGDTRPRVSGPHALRCRPVVAPTRARPGTSGVRRHRRVDIKTTSRSAPPRLHRGRYGGNSATGDGHRGADPRRFR